jgi:sugar lactone lactonase YvrE
MMATAAGLLVAVSGASAASDIAIPGNHVFPESITSSKDGTIYIGSIGEGAIFRVATAALFVKSNPDLRSVTGVLADDNSGTLYACTNDWSMFGVTTPGGKGPSTLKVFDLKTGAPKGSYVLPGKFAFCNDIAVGRDGAAYVTDSIVPRVLRLKPGAKELEVWVQDPIFGTKGINLDGIAFGPDGYLYLTGFGSGKLFRVAVGKDMQAGAIEELAPLSPLQNPDGMRPLAGGTGTQFLLAEGGHLTLVTVDGPQFEARVLKSDAGGSVAVTQVGNAAWVLLGQLNYIFDPSLKGKTPQPFTAVAVGLK